MWRHRRLLAAICRLPPTDNPEIRPPGNIYELYMLAAFNALKAGCRVHISNIYTQQPSVQQRFVRWCLDTPGVPNTF